MEFIRSDRYAQLALYEERNNMYRYWLLHGARKGKYSHQRNSMYKR